jgi:hypothetical protein
MVFLNLCDYVYFNVIVCILNINDLLNRKGGGGLNTGVHEKIAVPVSFIQWHENIQTVHQDWSNVYQMLIFMHLYKYFSF